MPSRLPSIVALRSMTLDYRAGRLRMARYDGAEIDMPADVQTISGVTSVSLDIASETLRLVIDGFGPMEVELWPTANNSRPVVYLDQLHWISLAKAHHGTDMPNDVQRAALALIQLARDRKILLPLSGAHAVEMARTYGGRRRNLAGIMLELSRGWQMVSPLSVRLRELDNMFRHRQTQEVHTLNRSDVFTLSPWALWTDQYSKDRVRPRTEGELPLDVQDLVDRMMWVQSFYSTLAKDSRHDSINGRSKAQKWADSLNQLAQHMRGNPRAKPFRRDLTRMRFLADIETDLVAAAQANGVSGDEFGDWLANEAEGALAGLPHVGRARELTHYRLVNAEDSWEVNDLNDLLFLTCAAGYADVVVAEKKFGNYLLRASPAFPKPSFTAVRISEAIAKLSELIN